MIQKTLIAAITLASLSGAAIAQDKPVELRFGMWVSPAHPLVVSTTEWVESIREASGGSIVVTLYPSEQLGRAVDHYDLVRDGIADMALVNPGYNPGRFPIISYGEIPFLFSSAAAGSMALDEWYRAYAPEEMSEVQFCMAFVHSPGTIHSVQRITSPADLAGKSIRPANGTLGHYLSGQGATTLQASAAELRDLLSRGTADGTASPYSSLKTWGIEEFATHHLDMPMYAANFTYVISPMAWQRLSQAQQQVMKDHCSNKWAGQIVGKWAEEDLKELASLEANPAHEFVVPDDKQRTAWMAASEHVKELWRKLVASKGRDAAGIEASMKEAIARHGAGF